MGLLWCLIICCFIYLVNENFESLNFGYNSYCYCRKKYFYSIKKLCMTRYPPAAGGARDARGPPPPPGRDRSPLRGGDPYEDRYRDARDPYARHDPLARDPLARSVDILLAMLSALSGVVLVFLWLVTTQSEAYVLLCLQLQRS